MNITLLKEKSVRDEISESWRRWKKRKKYNANTVEWREKSVKQQIRKLFMRLGAETRHEESEMENVYCQCIYDILQNTEKRRRRMVEMS
jgi:chromatin segregation and condensation protein Rec8/ScpA/Scc1 (kleisin family)